MKLYLTIPVLLFALAVSPAQAKKRAQAPAPCSYNVTGGMPGIVVSGSCQYQQIPEDAKKFIRHNFKNNAVMSCSQDFNPQEYEVKLDDGTEIEFDAKGKWIEVEAGKSNYLPVKLVKHLLPHRAYDKLERLGVLPFVNDISYSDTGGYKVDLNHESLGDYIFDKDGRLLSFENKY